MSLRQQNLGSIVKPGFNPLGAQTTTTTYTYYLNSWGGNNGYGQLGLGNKTSYSSPKQVGSLTTWASTSGGSFFSGAVKTDGTLWMWGYNGSGQIGNGVSGASPSSPIQVGALTNWATVSCGYAFTIATKTDGTIWSWGQGSLGKLGLGNTTYYSSPKQIGALTNWYSVSAGPDSVIAIKTDGTMWAWGYNGNGQLGQNNTTNRSSPVQIGALTTWATATLNRGGSNSGNGYALAIKTDGTIWSWGYNSDGELGSGTTTNRSSPVQIGALTNWLKVVANGYTNAAIKTDGTLWTWGYGTFGQLGNSSVASVSSPIQIGGLTTWSTLAGGSNTVVFATKTDKTLWGWGRNATGELGLNNRTAYSSPVQVGSTADWGSVENGREHSLALRF
jgi:alpha-tubulin suppressor-like RCC1 family protein